MKGKQMVRTARPVSQPDFRFLPAFLLVAAALTAGCGKQPAEPQSVVQVQVLTVAPRSISEYVTGEAVLAPVAQAAISPKITAPVRKFYVARGSKVKAGQLLAVLDNQDLAAAALDSQGGYEQAQAAYNTATRVTIPADYQSASLGVRQAKADLDVAQQVYNSRVALFKQGAIAGREVDTAKAALIQAQSAYDIAKARFAGFQSVNHADAIKVAQGQLASAKGKYESAEAQLAFSEIRSPINGVVTERPLYAGETAPAGTPLLTVMDVTTMLAKVHLPEDQARLLKVGQAASVTPDGAGQSFPGTVSLISPALDPGSTTVEVWVKVPNRGGILKAGAPARVSIIAASVHNTIVVPKEAVLTGPSGEQTVMVVDSDNVAHRREVRIGISNRQNVQVLRGLQIGDTVITSGSYAMPDGSRVSIAPASNAASDDSSAGGAG